MALWLALLLSLTAGCSTAANGAAPDTGGQRIRDVLDASAAAVLHHDQKAYLAAFAPGAVSLRDAERREFASLRQVPLTSWRYRVTSLARTGTTATVRADLLYRISGYDKAPVATPRFLQFQESSGRWYVTLDRPGTGGAQQLWQQGPITTVRGERSLVLGTGQDRSWLRTISTVADRAVPAVSAAWPDRWARRVVVVVPASLDAMAALLGRSPDQYRGIAAVTTGETGGAGAAPADRIIVNPDAFKQLSDFGQQVVLTHEITHVATRGATSSATPTWLSEGFADWSAYRTADRTAGEIAPELRQAVRAGTGPRALPDDGQFAFGSGSDELARAYEEGWLACELIDQKWGHHKLVDFYRTVGAHAGRQGSVEAALHQVLGITPAAFTRLWLVYLKVRLG